MEAKKSEAAARLMRHLLKMSYKTTDKALHDFLEAWLSSVSAKYYDPEVALESLRARIDFMLIWYREALAGHQSAFDEYEARG